MLFESDNPSGNYVLMDTTDEGIPISKGVSPKAMMLSSLAGCSGIDIVDILKKMKITDYNLKIAEGELTEEHPKYYHTVYVNYYFSGPEIDKKNAIELYNCRLINIVELWKCSASLQQ